MKEHSQEPKKIELIDIVEARRFRIEKTGLPSAHEFLIHAEKIAREATNRNFAIEGFGVERYGTNQLEVTLRGKTPLIHCERCEAPLRPVGYLAASFPKIKGQPNFKPQSKNRARLCAQCDRKTVYLDKKLGGQINGL